MRFSVKKFFWCNQPPERQKKQFDKQKIDKKNKKYIFWSKITLWGKKTLIRELRRPLGKTKIIILA